MIDYLFDNKATGWLKKADALSIQQILWIAAFFRIVAAVFSRGYGMHDDHFLVIEVAQGWIDGQNIYNWLPSKVPGAIPNISHDLFYNGINYLILLGLQTIGIIDPQIKMMVVRIVHGVYSLLAVYYTYKITENYSNSRYARYAALFVSLLWFMPNLSVRNLAEVVCIPPLLAGYWYLIKNDKPNWKEYLLAGFLIGFAFSIRYQTVVFIGGTGLVLLWQNKLKGLSLFSIGFLLNVFLFQCITDIVLWGYPLAEFFGYVNLNMTGTPYFDLYWFHYLMFITGVVLPPFGILLWLGYITSAKQAAILFFPSLLFLAVHSYLGNRQERFILPFIPFLIILGFVGWETVKNYLLRYRVILKILRAFAVFAIAVNFLLLIIFSVSSTKSSHMDSMTYLYKRHDLKAFITDGSGTDTWQFFPRYYLGKWADEYYLWKDYQIDNAKMRIAVGETPNYVVFISPDDLNNRIAKFKNLYPHITYLTTIQPSFIDWVFFKLNPVNRNEACYIYHIDP